MNYLKFYELITTNAKSRGLNKKLLDGYFERHHIIPRCFNGSNKSENLVYLTYKEHVICHHLLYKHYKDLFLNDKSRNKEYYKMMYAYNRMINKRNEFKMTIKQHENFRIEFSKNHSMLMSGEGNGFYGRKHSEETKKHLSEIKKRDFKGYVGNEHPMFGRKGNNNPRFGMKHSDNAKLKQSISHIGKYHGNKSGVSKKCYVYGNEFKTVYEAKIFCSKNYNISYKKFDEYINDINNKDFIKEHK